MRVVVMVVSALPARTCHCLGQVLNIRQLAILRSIFEIRCKLAELACGRSISSLLRSLGGGLKIGRDLLRNLLIFGWVGLLQLLKRTQKLRKRREVAAV